MENRIQRLEQNVDNLSTAVNKISNRMDQIVDVIGNLKTAIESNKPLSYTSILTTAIGTAVIVSMVVGAIFFLVDARVGSATTRANSFVSDMTDKGSLYVQMDRLAYRLERVESAIRWQPTLVNSFETAAQKK